MAGRLAVRVVVGEQFVQPLAARICDRRVESDNLQALAHRSLACMHQLGFADLDQT